MMNIAQYVENRRLLRFLFITLFSFAISMTAEAQKVSLGTDAIQWANFGTANLEMGISVHQHLSLSIGGRYNPWDFHSQSGLLVRNQQAGGYLGLRYWPWYVYSGWWIGAKVQYADYSRTGVWRQALEEGQRVGGGLSFGYTVMLNEHFNLEFGAGVWGGRALKYTLYECPVCMDVRKMGPCNFMDIDNVSLSMFYVF